MSNFNYCVFIGQFSPYLLGHSSLLQEALNQAEKVIVVVGSSRKARNIKTPWSFDERVEMIKSTLSSQDLSRISFISLKDQLYNDTSWSTDLLQQISLQINKNDTVALVCGEKDNSEYLKLFPQWTLIPVKSDQPYHHSEDVRYRYFTYDNSYKFYVHEKVKVFLEYFQKTQEFELLKSDFDYIKKYKAAWADCPFPPTFVTVDAICLRSSHILCVVRKGNPGKGQIALPGGFLNQDESLEDAVVRELREETVIKMDKKELKKHIKDHKMFDFPERSLRGRTLTMAYFFDLGNGPLINVKGSDDALKAFWLPLNEVKEKEDQFFEDHFSIINYFVSL